MPPARSGTVKAWPGRRTLAAVMFLGATALGAPGCGQATVPCPTPTTQLDRLRDETERLREDADRAHTEEGAWDARREAAAQRVSDIQARLDSLAAVRHH